MQPEEFENQISTIRPYIKIVLDENKKKMEEALQNFASVTLCSTGEIEKAMGALSSYGCTAAEAGKRLKEALETFSKTKFNGRIKDGRIYFKRRKCYKR